MKEKRKEWNFFGSDEVVLKNTKGRSRSLQAGWGFFAQMEGY
jgi:hypothetical protein